MSLQWETIRDAALEETYYRCKHPSGLELQVCPKAGYTSSYAVFSTKYGSIDTTILKDGTMLPIPEGTAHFLEHKLFESEELGAFARFAQTGASANAYTSFEKTAYEFTSSAHFEENLEILLDFVQSPYFTQATVEKEQGIIGQEIRTGLDSPGWEVFFRLLKLLYPQHPVRIEIAGTEQSIAEINAEILHNCYGHYYHLQNMILAVAGSATPEQVELVANRALKTPSQTAQVRRAPLSDIAAPKETLARRAMEVAAPLFLLGCKEQMVDSTLSIKDIVLSELVLDILLGQASPRYEQLLDEGLVNAGFASELLHGWGYSCALFEGESKHPEQAAQQIKSLIRSSLAQGLSPAEFERARKAAYGRLVTNCNDIDWLANHMTDDYFAGADFYARARALRAATVEEANRRAAQMFSKELFALSIIEPIARQEGQS